MHQSRRVDVCMCKRARTLFYEVKDEAGICNRFTGAVCGLLKL